MEGRKKNRDVALESLVKPMFVVDLKPLSFGGWIPEDATLCLIKTQKRWNAIIQMEMSFSPKCITVPKKKDSM